MLQSLLPSFSNELEDVARAWLPRVADFEGWGFHENWTFDWMKEPDDRRFLVFQGRLTWVAGALGLFYPHQKDVMSECALHGCRGLMEVMWDKKHGGWWWMTDPDGKPLSLSLEQKHLYGISFGLYGLASALRLTGDPQVKAWLEEAFAWTDISAHDELHGGMRDALSIEGIVLTRAIHPDYPRDFLGSPYGHRAQNTALHVLEALTEVYRALPNPTTQARLEEMLEITLTKMLLPEGWLGVQFTRDWTPTDIRPSYGHDIEAAFLIVEARRALGRPKGREDEIAEKIALTALAGVDEERGGFWDSAWTKARGTRKTWWAQAEALGAMALFAGRPGPNQEKFASAAQAQWRHILRFQVDKKHGGWIPDTNAVGEPFPDQGKSHRWQGAYHEVRGLMTAILAAQGTDP